MEKKIEERSIRERIYFIRNVYVMIDSDLAEIYEVSTSRINEQVKRNLNRFPSDFYFQLSNDEWNNLKSQNAMSSWGGRRKNPFVFTEHGVAALSGVLKSQKAVEIQISVIRAFIAMRRLLSTELKLVNRMEIIEEKQHEAENKLNRVFEFINTTNITPDQGVFFDGKIFDSYLFVSNLIKSAHKTIHIIDNFINEETLSIITKKRKGVEVTLLTRRVSNILIKDVEKVNLQYGGFEIVKFQKSHDRFIIIDEEEEIYHVGASLKDLGKKWFAFSKLNKETVASIMEALHIIIN